MAATRDLNGFRHSHTGSTRLWYGAGNEYGGTMSNASGTLYAMPYPDRGATGTVGGAMVAFAGTNAGHYLRAAIYVSDGTPNLYPVTRVMDCGCFGCALGQQTNSLAAYTVTTGALHWLVTWGTTGVGGNVRAAHAPLWPVMGVDYTMTNLGAITAPYTGDLPTNGFPSTFPTVGRALLSGSVPAVFLCYTGA